MPVLPPGSIGDWNVTRLTKFVEDWFRTHSLPPVKSLQVDDLLLDGASLSETLAAASPGAEIGYDQITATVNVTGSTSATANTIIAGTDYEFDGSPVRFEIASPAVVTPGAAAGNITAVGIFEGSTLISIPFEAEAPAAIAYQVPMLMAQRFTPSPGRHTYSVKAWATNTTGTPRVVAGGGIAGAFAPAYLWITKV